MDRGIALLSPRERQVLALLARCHDAKSIARTLQLSIHTVNEQLRAARHKLGVSSSREAARLLLESEGEGPQILGDEEFGIGGFGRGAKSIPMTQASVPMIVATDPAQGSVIAPGPFQLSVTFDQPMGEGYSFVQVSPDSFPQCEHRASRSPDQRTFTMRCFAEAGKSYEVWFNRPPYMNFRASSGAAAHPTRLLFSVRDS